MFDVLYPKFVTDWNNKRSDTVEFREMEEAMETPRTHSSLGPAALSEQLESSRTRRDCGNDMEPLSPLPAPRGAAPADQGNGFRDTSKTVLDDGNKDSAAKMRRIAAILQRLPDRERYYASEPESMHAIDTNAKPGWRRLGQEQLTASFSPKRRDLSSPKNAGYSSDGYSSSEGTQEESGPQELPNGYRAGRSPDRDPISFGANNGVDDDKGDAKRLQFFQNYLKSGGYEELDNHSKYHHQSTVGSTRVPAQENNPLAAMLQKFAVGNGFSASPLRNVVPISASLYAGEGLPKKRRYRNEAVFPAAVSYGMPSVNGSGGIMVQTGNDRSVDHSDVFICHICSFVATSNEDFKLHMTIHYDYQCPHCTYSSRTEGRLKHHIKYFHEAATMDPGDEGTQDSRHFQKTNQPKKFRCRQCHFISYSREEHWNHISVHIKKEKQLKCIHCPFVTEFKHHLEYHIRNHNNSKPYKCSKCNYTCVNKSMLNSHMKSHTNVYQFRCASCKYATKYSHSLKLHLINKRHLPAVVLNPDGSLPTDGSGSFDLISKRGPPRGPCGPRKSKMAADDMSPPALLPIFPTSTSSMMSFGHAGEFPWMTAARNNGKPVNGVAIPGGTTLPPPPPISGALRAGTVARPDRSLGYPLNILSQLSSSVASSSVVGYPGVSTSVPCGFCPATFSSLTLLADHVRLEHAVRLGGCGVKLETDLSAQEPASGDIHLLSERGGEIERKRNSVPAEIPLDLSSKNSDGAKRTALKRSAARDDEDSSFTVSPSSAAMSRKRSRKGKACKLDELSLKLQDHWKEEDGLLDGSESSSMDDECHSGLRGGGPGMAGKESENLNTEERKFFEVGCGTSSPLDDNGVRRKELTQYSDADSSDQRHDSVRKSVASGESPKPAEFSDKEPGIGGNADGCSVTSRAKRVSPARQTPDNGYYTCNHCDMGFRDNVTHFLHMGYHTYDDPFKCNKCGHRSTNAIDFFVHMARVAHAQ